ncbi:MAG TPA: aspartate kinase [Flavipsychrobacter sp.]|nr:aspartate kinase [Flavipsychrobacter sp.]
MEVYKFGGASIATPDRMEGLLPVIEGGPRPLVLVVSALGKTTNALEAIVNAACKGDKKQAQELAKELEQKHLDYARALLTDENYKKVAAELNVYFTELQWAIDDADGNRYDYSYDQVVCIGELFSTKIFSAYLDQKGIENEWVDARDIIRTDDTFRDAVVDWSYSQNQAEQVAGAVLKQGKSVITQGFIGSTADNASVTLGREGSDYTAAMMAAMLGAKGVTIWKDVEGLQNADPKEFANTVKIEAITYHEVIEMAYYGAQVIHPKTIKPLQNNEIPLYVKCFLDKNLKGTVIKNEVAGFHYPPLIINKKNQVLIQATTKDFSFITEYNLSHIYQVFSELNIKINMMQNAAISFIACVDNREDKVKKLVEALEGEYKLLRNENVSLLTIRHYTEEVLFDLTRNKIKLLEQKTRHTVQVVTM